MTHFAFPLAETAPTIPITEAIGNVLTQPLSALSLLIGALLVLGTSAAMGYLTLGAIADLLTPDRTGPPPGP